MSFASLPIEIQQIVIEYAFDTRLYKEPKEGRWKLEFVPAWTDAVTFKQQYASLSLACKSTLNLLEFSPSIRRYAAYMRLFTKHPINLEHVGHDHFYTHGYDRGMTLEPRHDVSPKEVTKPLYESRIWCKHLADDIFAYLTLPQDMAFDEIRVCAELADCWLEYLVAKLCTLLRGQNGTCVFVKRLLIADCGDDHEWAFENRRRRNYPDTMDPATIETWLWALDAVLCRLTGLDRVITDPALCPCGKIEFNPEYVFDKYLCDSCDGQIEFGGLCVSCKMCACCKCLICNDCIDLDHSKLVHRF
jgi:hypothetical protein